MKRLLTCRAWVVLPAAVILGLAACDSSESELDAAASLDVAESVATLVSEDNGGVLEQVVDVFELASAGTIEAQTAGIAGKLISGSTVERSYDESAQMWRIQISREREDSDGDRYMSMERTYAVQFLDGGGIPQKFLVTAGVHARSMTFRIDDGGSTLHTPRIEAETRDLSGEWTATGIDTDVVTLSGTYHREGSHKITGAEAERTLEFSADLTVTDLTGPKGSRLDLSRKLSGTIEGHWEGKATFTRGDIYRERQIDRDVTIEIQDGVQTIYVDGEQLSADVRTGVIREDGFRLR
jgi:hypothetical protein